ncbi:TIGR03618 family F420-dependent PPOX class oxidoreductase [Actinoplanes sp. CA-015351]|uniref:TIGR03618 family F420-dependent PPOX class oxidoreductase n=1 Tax=Actinoplanes sp. CA-015351 TaxID=3239897 RepID=UPI003D99797A
MTSFLLGPAALSVRATQAPVVILDATVELAKALQDGDHRAVSGLAGWAESHIPGSRHADLLHDLSDPGSGLHFTHPSAPELAARLAALGVRPDVPVVTYDRGDGIWASRLWWLLDWLGLEAYVLDGGLQAWQEAGLPVTSSERVELGFDPNPESTRAGGNAGACGVEVRSAPEIDTRDVASRWVGRAEIEEWLAGRVEASVVCALNPEAFAGEVPTRYSRRGHIPGTANLPARSLIGADGTFRPEPELREVLADLLADPAPIWLYCGGGISATTLGLALRELGRDDVALYDGSLEEWSADPALPIERGRSASGAAVIPDEVRELIERPEFAVLSTTEPDGRAQLSVMWAALDGNDLVMTTKAGRRKVRNIERDPRVTVLIHDRQRPTSYAEIRGVARITAGDPAGLVHQLARRYTGADHVIPDPAQEAGRVILRITPEKVLFRP